MRIKLFFLFLALSALACMKQTYEVSSSIPTKISAKSSTTPTNSPHATQTPVNAPKPASVSVYVTALETLNIRSDHNSDAQTLGYLVNGEDVTIYECWGDWARIGAGRWVNSFYLSKPCT